jgi:hypothetical protein
VFESINKCKERLKSVKCMHFTVAVKSQTTGCVREYFERESSKMTADLGKCSRDLCPRHGNTRYHRELQLMLLALYLIKFFILFVSA